MADDDADRISSTTWSTTLPHRSPPPAPPGKASHLTLLIFTNSDAGQSNPILAMIYSVLVAAPHVKIHLAADPPLQPGLAATVKHAAAAVRAVTEPEFHAMANQSMWCAASRPEVGLRRACDRGPGLRAAGRGMSAMPAIVQPWTGPEFADIYVECRALVRDIKPDLVLVEPLMSPAVTLMDHLAGSPPWMMIAPNSIKDFALRAQPNLGMLWKYPQIGSGLAYPLRGLDVAKNVALGLLAFAAFRRSARFTDALDELRQPGLEPTLRKLTTSADLGVLALPPPGFRVIVAGAPELDYPLDRVPEYVTAVGPLIRPADPVSAAAARDPGLADWLAQTRAAAIPLVLINLGTQVAITTPEAVKMAWAINRFLTRAGQSEPGRPLSQVRVLWKFIRKEAVEAEAGAATPAAVPFRPLAEWRVVDNILRSWIKSGQVVRRAWLHVDPGAILRTGMVVCSVHHGGANSFNEAICFGIPQVVLPVWADCYDFANRAELLGVGRWGNRRHMPRWDGDELCAAICDVVLGPRAHAIKGRCVDLARDFPECRGRDLAANLVVSRIEQASVEQRRRAAG